LRFCLIAGDQKKMVSSRATRQREVSSLYRGGEEDRTGTGSSRRTARRPRVPKGKGKGRRPWASTTDSERELEEEVPHRELVDEEVPPRTDEAEDGDQGEDDERLVGVDGDGDEDLDGDGAGSATSTVYLRGPASLPPVPHQQHKGVLCPDGQT
jgi:hypothetical protein